MSSQAKNRASTKQEPSMPWTDGLVGVRRTDGQIVTSSSRGPLLWLDGAVLFMRVPRCPTDGCVDSVTFYDTLVTTWQTPELRPAQETHCA